MKKEKTLSFEIMRCIACFGVVGLHMLQGLAYMYGKVPINIWNVASVVTNVCRYSVPLFLMISGALLIKKDDINIRWVIKKATYFFIILLIWSIIYVVADMYINNVDYSVKDFFVGFMGDSIKYHLWYLYMLIGIYIMLPLIIQLARSKHIKIYLVFFIVVMIINIIPLILKTYFGFDIQIYVMIPLMDWQLGCFILGYVIDSITINLRSFIVSLVVFVCSGWFMVYSTYRLSLGANEYRRDFSSNENIFAIAMAVCVFIMIKYVSKYAEKSFVKKVIECISKRTFYIYLVHPLVIMLYRGNVEVKVTKMFGIYNKLAIREIFSWCVVFFASYIVAEITKFVWMYLYRFISIRKVDNGDS